MLSDQQSRGIFLKFGEKIHCFYRYECLNTGELFLKKYFLHTVIPRVGYDTPRLF